MSERVVYRRVVRSGSVARPGWCIEHNDFAWRWSDGSVSCFWACIVETGTDQCEVVVGGLSLPRGTIRPEPAPERSGGMG